MKFVKQTCTNEGVVHICIFISTGAEAKDCAEQLLRQLHGWSSRQGLKLKVVLERSIDEGYYEVSINGVLVHSKFHLKHEYLRDFHDHPLFLRAIDDPCGNIG
eukprot:TRINITY_DN14511_c0_g1_i1.p2 TRINITY_DN14511_c0_g1~~TRINITY_DN14511_c0_g1_i1.p2  ORF type:complete len:103 (-),score=21.88 TRINITY_DN14511_c0_g1_i1:303-611(-)